MSDSNYSKSYVSLDSMLGTNSSSSYIIPAIKESLYAGAIMQTTSALFGQDFAQRQYQSESAFSGFDRSYGSSKVTYNSGTTGTVSYTANADIFLSFARPLARFIDTVEEVQEIVNETFVSLTGKKLDNVVIKVCKGNESDLIKQGFRSGVLGLAINNHNMPGIILVRNDFLDRMIVTIGHEIGHLLSPSLDDIRSEEAKAFAFELAWVNKIKELNIGNLGRSLNLPQPANNGIHDIALTFVVSKIAEGKEPLSLHKELSAGTVSLSESLESIIF